MQQKQRYLNVVNIYLMLFYQAEKQVERSLEDPEFVSRSFGHDIIAPTTGTHTFMKAFAVLRKT